MDNNTSNGCGLLLLMFLAISAFAGFLTVFRVQSESADVYLMPTVAVQEEAAVEIVVTPAFAATEVAVEIVVVTAVPVDAAPSDTPLAITVLGAGDLSAEAVELINTGDTLDLSGWQIADEDGNMFTFPSYILYGGGVVRVLTQAGDDGVISLHWGLDAAIWSVGETLTVSDVAGTVRAKVVVDQ
jgi:hypothetical protein